VNVWILECHNLSIVCPWSEVWSLRWSLGCVLVVQFSVCEAVVHLYVLRRCSLRRVSSSTQSRRLVLLEIRLAWKKNRKMERVSKWRIENQTYIGGWKALCCRCH
jgi:hypothetical protein